MGSMLAAVQLQISYGEVEMHWLERYSRIHVVSWYLSGTLESGQMCDNVEIFGLVLGLF